MTIASRAAQQLTTKWTHQSVAGKLTETIKLTTRSRRDPSVAPNLARSGPSIRHFSAPNTRKLTYRMI